MSISFLESAVEDAVISISEDCYFADSRVPQVIDVFFTADEWVAVERFHRLRVEKSGKTRLTDDRYPFIRLNVVGVAVNLFPEPKPVETVH